ncbi:MAG: VWA domain-containing protein [Chloroflexi bacterium]|nr:VWA domain-containing protein [Chloroflexota bacterium]
MSLLSPLALLFGLLAAPVIALYLLRLRRRERRVSSTFLWRQVTRDLEANAPWQKLRPNLLLLLQLLILAALVFALARPVWLRDSRVQGDLLLVLDTSASMQAADVAPTRFGAAQQKALEWIDRLPAGHLASIILMGETPAVLVAQSSDRGRLREAVTQARPGTGGANLEAALSLAASLVREGGRSEVVVLSDGNVTSIRPPGAMPFVLRHESIGTPTGNLAVDAFSTRRAAAGLDGLARVSNYGPAAGAVSVQLYADGKLYDMRDIEVPPGGDSVVRWSALPGAALFEVRLVPGDIFPLDDRAWAAGGSGDAARALLVTGGNRFLEKALSLQPGLELTLARPESFSGQGDYDLWVFDGFLPRELPRGAVFILAPPAGGVSWVSQVPAPVRGLRPGESGLLEYVDLSELHIREALTLRLPPEAQSLLESDEGYLAAVWDEPQRRMAVFAFDLHDSDLPLQPTFPILVQHLVSWLLPGLGSGLNVRSGEVVNAPVSPQAGRAWVETPGGQRVQVAPPFPPDPLPADQLGVYRVVQELDGKEHVNYFVANLFRPEESALSPSALPSVATGPAETPGDRHVPWEISPWLALAALAVLGLEWWVYSRGY